MNRSRRSPSPSRHRSSHRHRSPSPKSKSTGEPEVEGFVPSSFIGKNEARERDDKNILERMDNSSGPLRLLHRACKKKLKVKVWTRNFKEMRGISTGYLQLFDKHWNLALSDVEEICLKPKKGKTPYLEGVQIENLNILPEAKPKEFVPKKPKVTTEEAPQPEPSTPPEPAPVEMEVVSAEDVTVKVEIKQEDDDDDDCQIITSEGETTDTDVVVKAEGQAEAEPKKKRVRRKKKNVIERRCVGQLFIRGDNVVMISVLEP